MQDINNCRAHFPVLAQSVYDKPLVYLDNAATTQMPQSVIDCISNYYSYYHANVHRGVHYLSEQATDKYEQARVIVQNFINAALPREIIFTGGATGGINMVAHGLESLLRPGDEIIASQLEHHANFVPWQQLCVKTGARFNVIPAVESNIDLTAFEKMLNPRTKLVAVTHVSNLTGTLNPVKAIIERAHFVGAMTLVDGAQAMRHGIVDVQALDCDFYCFSGHKLCGPTGIGVLYGKENVLEKLRPSTWGGGMVDRVSRETTTLGPLPSRLEAGTPNIAGAVALGAALEYLSDIGRTAIAEQEQRLLDYAEAELIQINGVHILGQPRKRVGVLSFYVDDIHPYDIASLLDKQGVAVRSGTHCAQPALAGLGVEHAVRISPAFYNTFADMDSFAAGLHKTLEMLKKWSRP